MAIDTQCPNGHLVRVKEHLAGRPVRCPTCATKFRVAAGSHLPLARFVPLAPEVVATLPRARPLVAGGRLPASGAVPMDVHHDVGGSLSPGNIGGDALEPAPGLQRKPTVRPEQAWRVVEADEPGGADRWLDAGNRAAEPIEPVPAAECRPHLALHAAIAERPEATWCIAFPGGDPTDPLDAETMQAWLDGGHATGTEVVWRADWPEWRPVREVFPDLFGVRFGF